MHICITAADVMKHNYRSTQCVKAMLISYSTMNTENSRLLRRKHLPQTYWRCESLISSKPRRNNSPSLHIQAIILFHTQSVLYKICIVFKEEQLQVWAHRFKSPYAHFLFRVYDTSMTNQCNHPRTGSKVLFIRDKFQIAPSTKRFH